MSKVSVKSEDGKKLDIKGSDTASMALGVILTLLAVAAAVTAVGLFLNLGFIESITAFSNISETTRYGVAAGVAGGALVSASLAGKSFKEGSTTVEQSDNKEVSEQHKEPTRSPDKNQKPARKQQQGDGTWAEKHQHRNRSTETPGRSQS